MLGRRRRYSFTYLRAVGDRRARSLLVPLATDEPQLTADAIEATERQLQHLAEAQPRGDVRPDQRTIADVLVGGAIVGSEHLLDLALGQDLGRFLRRCDAWHFHQQITSCELQVLVDVLGGEDLERAESAGDAILRSSDASLVVHPGVYRARGDRAQDLLLPWRSRKRMKASNALLYLTTVSVRSAVPDLEDSPGSRGAADQAAPRHTRGQPRRLTDGASPPAFEFGPPGPPHFTTIRREVSNPRHSPRAVGDDGASAAVKDRRSFRRLTPACRWPSRVAGRSSDPPSAIDG